MPITPQSFRDRAQQIAAELGLDDQGLLRARQILSSPQTYRGMADAVIGNVPPMPPT